MGLYKNSSGLLFDDGFDSGSIHARYVLSPANTGDLDAGKGQFVLQHTEDDNLILFDIPDNEFSLLFEVTADYVPTEYGDEGGIVVWKDGESRIEFLESMDTATREYSKWRALRRGNRWTFFADRGSGWELFDTASMVASKLGVALKGRAINGYDSMRIDKMVLCRSDKLSVGNLPEGYTVYLCDPGGHAIASSTVEKNWTGVELNVPEMPYHGILRVYDVAGNLVSSLGAFDLYGGDSYLYGTELKVQWKGKELNVTGDTHLGTMYDNQIMIQMELINPSADKPARQIRMGILQHLDEFGYEWVDLCHDDGLDAPLDHVSPLLEFQEVPPLGSVKFWMKVERKFDHFGIKPISFILDINHV
ncbi:cell adhesion protein [Paenibacillus oryzae]|uniref:Cell adhesion protein n=1 Tax=Paenibacillus oryzae TaxID=1844972 RepID=A0A1A5YQA5_9BACL|nr:cell adhesion protein [Paenibacillus oryzae]OBR67753.1 cell adhesion protein [Paenibacillus oryzae]